VRKLVLFTLALLAVYRIGFPQFHSGDQRARCWTSFFRRAVNRARHLDLFSGGNFRR